MSLRARVALGLVLLASCAEERPLAGTDDTGGTSEANGKSAPSSTTTSAGTTRTDATGSSFACGCIVSKGILTVDLPCDYALCIFGETDACIANATVLETAGETCTTTSASDAGTITGDAGADAGTRITPR